MRRPFFVITARTELVALLGHPVGHSLSPRMHNAAFRAQKIDLVYLAFDVPPELLEEAVRGIRALRVRGANVTIPHKERVLTLLDEVDPVAAMVGAVNTIVNQERRLIGHNTDVEGFRAALRRLRPQGARGLRCLVAGAGGASRAVVAALLQDGAAEVLVYNRTESRARTLCADAAHWGSAPCEVVSGHNLRAQARDAHLLVNATSVGLSPSIKESVLPVDILHSGQIVIDLVYAARSTELVAAAARAGAKALDGREMLLLQAAGSYRLWTGGEAPLEVMRSALGQEHREGKAEHAGR